MSCPPVALVPRPCRLSAAVLAMIVGAGLMLGRTDSAVAGSSVVFGPKEYVLAQKPSLLVVERFPACRPERGGRLLVENGPNGRPRATAAVLVLNRRETLVVYEGPRQPPVRERAVALEADNTLFVWMIGPPGATVVVSLVSDAGCLEIALATPAPDASVPAGLLLVRGAVQGAPEVGVAVNGIPAAVDAGAFAALVPVDPTVTELVAVATTPDGQTAQTRQPLTVTPAPESVILFGAGPASGVAPLTVTFTLSSLVGASQVALDLEGDGTVDFDGGSFEEQALTYGTPGLYTPRLTVTDVDGLQHTATTIVQVYDRAALDALLQSKWTRLREALGRDDVETAVRVFAESSKEPYRDQLTRLADAGALGRVANDLGTITLVRVRDRAAEYDLRAVRDGVEYSFHVLFVIDEDGTWRLWTF